MANFSRDSVVIRKTDLWPKIKANLSLANKSSVSIGWPSGKPETTARHPESNETNVEIAALLHMGRPMNSAVKQPAIPARPFFDALWAKHLMDYKANVHTLLRMISQGEMSTAIALERIGAGVRGDLQKIFSDPASMAYSPLGSGWKMANSPYTIMQKGSSTPLVDHGYLRKSITWKVTMRGSK